MVRGIEKFKEQFMGFEGKYSLIGGVACGLLLDDAGLEFRGTQDFDMVLIVEAMDDQFGRAIWDFIKSGEYTVREKSNGEPEFYRFMNPKDESYPKEAEEDVDLKNLHIRGRKAEILERIAAAYGIDL